MGLFRRNRRDDEASVTPGAATDPAEAADDRPEGDAPQPGEASAPTRPVVETSEDWGDLDPDTLGPWDSGDLDRLPGTTELLKMGAIWMPIIDGLQLSFEVDEASAQVTAVRLGIADSALQLQAFAAPRSSGIWEEIRGEIAASITGPDASAEEVTGPLGVELVVRMPQADPAGRPVAATMRFIGVDGPRWFLRGVLSGPAATDEELARPFRHLMRVLVVDRGQAPMAPRELLELAFPDAADPEPDPEPGRSADDLDPFTRGPEITEIR